MKILEGIKNFFMAGYDAGEKNLRQRRDLGWGRAVPKDEDTLLADGSREYIRQRCADLRRNNAIVAGVCRRLSSFVVGEGIFPQAKTSSREWNKEAEKFWEYYSKTCDFKNRLSLWQIQNIIVGYRPTHGGMYIQLLSNGQINLIEPERIRTPFGYKAREDDSFYIVDGVLIEKKTGRVLGYYVFSRDSNGMFSNKSVVEFVEAKNMITVLAPFWRADQIREIPDLAPVVPHLQDIHEMNQYTLNTAKVQSMLTGFLKKVTGGGLNSLPRGSNIAQGYGQRQIFKYDWGQILEGFPNEDLEFKVSPTPSSQHIPYIQMQLGLCAAALDFPYEFFTLDFSKCDYSRFKGVLLWVNRTCRIWRAWLNENLNSKLWNWRIAKAIKEGDLPSAPVDNNGMSEWYKVEWQAPEEMWVDRQESNQADMLEWQLGLGSLAKAAKRRGTDIEELLREKAETILLAAEIEKEYNLIPGSLIKAQIPGQTNTDTGVKDNA